MGTKEIEKARAYWDGAALADARREAVTQWPGETDEQYERRWATEGNYVAEKICVHARRNPLALEIGPGLGRITVPMAIRSKSILALDISPEMLRRASETLRFVPNVRFGLIEDPDLGFLSPNQFDLAYSIATFQHVEKKSCYRYIRGIQRALKPGGVLFIGVLNLFSERGWGHFERVLCNDYPEYFHTPDELAAYLTHAGFEHYSFEFEGETLFAVAHKDY